MRVFRKVVELGYEFLRPRLIRKIKKKKRYLEIAHQNFIDLSQFLWKNWLTNLLLNSRENSYECAVQFANAAGSNKNGDISPAMWNALGMDIVTVGTVTYDPWAGNDLEQRIWDHGPMLMENNLDLPGVGAREVRKNLQQFGSLDEYHIRLNWMSTPGKQGDELLEDIQHTVFALRKYVDSFELNISCPNTGHEGDTRDQYQKSLDAMLQIVTPHLQGKLLYLKISPDIDLEGVKQILEICSHYEAVKGFTISNTTKKHKNPYGKVFGGGSGDYVYDLAMKAQRIFAKEIFNDYLLYHWQINACGGISTVERAKERIQFGNVKEIHLYTPLIYRGPALMRELRRELRV